MCKLNLFYTSLCMKTVFYVVKHIVGNHNYILMLRKLQVSFSKSYLKKQLEIIVCKTTIFQCYLISKTSVILT